MTADAGRYRRVYVNDWHHPSFRRLNDGARIVRLYVTAGPQTTSVGCFRLSSAVAVEDLGGTAEQFEAQLDIVCQAFNWMRDPLSRVIWIRDWFETNPPASPNVVASWVKLLRNVPDCDVRDEAIYSIAASLKNLPATFREPFADLSKTSRRPEVRPEVRPETNQGAGIRDLGSESEGTGAPRADGSDGVGFSKDLPENVRLIASKAVTFSKGEAPEEQERIFWDFWNRANPGVAANHRHVQQALNDARLGVRRTA